jgi:hypothetical protein
MIRAGAGIFSCDFSLEPPPGVDEENEPETVMRNSNQLITMTLLGLAACATTETSDEGPPFVDDSHSLGNGKADGSLTLGTSKVLGQQSGYRSDSVPFSCTPGGTVGFDVTYKNQSLPWGVKLSLWRGMAGEEWCGGCEPAYYGTFDWSYHQVDDMTASGPWQWSTHTESYGYGAGAGGRFTEMKYVVRIKMPDGSIRWDNGGSNVGYYRVLVPDPKCEASWTPWVSHNSAMADLSVVAVPKY